MAAETTGLFTITIDDDPIIPKMIEAFTGMKTLAATSPATFATLKVPSKPAAIFVDVHLGMDELGIDLIPQILAQWPFTPVIVVTSDQDGQAVAQALAAGAHDFVRKPLDAIEIAARLRVRIAEQFERSGRDLVQVGDLTLNLELNEISTTNGHAYLSAADMRMLMVFSQAHGANLSREELKRIVWGQVKVTENALDRRVFEIRQALSAVGSEVSIVAQYRKGLSLVLKKAG